MKTQLLLPAAGTGERLGRDVPKALVEVAGKPLLVWTLTRFAPLGLVDGAVIVVPRPHQGRFAEVLGEAFPGRRFELTPGGPARQDSVANGLGALDSDTEVVVIHDAARPFVSPESVRASIEAAAAYGAATVALPCVDTILEADRDECLAATPDRGKLWACQTPQTFRVGVIRRAHERAALGARNATRARHTTGVTDDATLVREMGERVKLVMGTRLNFKVTTPQDLELAEACLNTPGMGIAQGGCGLRQAL